MNLEDFIKTNPTREAVKQMLCETANYYVLSIEELWCFRSLAESFNFSIDEFYDDQDELTEYERNYVGLYNWKIR